MRLVVVAALGAALGCSPAQAPAVAQAASTCGAGATLWLDFEGAGVVNATADDSSAMPVQSRLAPSSAVIPPFDATTIAPGVTRDQAIAAVVDRVRTLFRPFAVTVTTTRPAATPYTRVLVGGTDTALGVASMEAGLSIVDCGNLVADDVAYDFSAAQTPDYGGVVGIANTAAHEAGHTFGLEHVDAPGDVMYAVAQPTQTLPDLFTLAFGSGNYSAYGESGRLCTAADPVDEVALLDCAVGAAAPGGDVTPPTLDFPAPTADVTAPVAVTAQASDDVGVVRVEIYKNLELVASLVAPPYTASIDAAPGERFYVTVEAIDAAANRATVTRAFAAAATPNLPGGLADGGSAPADAGASAAVASPAGGCSLGGAPAPSSPLGLLLGLVVAFVVRAWRRSSASG